MTKFAGIDYGSKLAGTTVIAYLNDQNVVTCIGSEKKKSADDFILKWTVKHQPTHIFIDAPLSLPKVYTDPGNHTDYFYRKGDRLLKGMSPMFLGGLTARAMKLKRTLINSNIKVFETYPAIHAKEFNLSTLNYKKQVKHLPPVIAFLKEKLPFSIDECAIKSWHHVDAILAFYTTYRYQEGICTTYGDADEGLIYV